MPEIAIKPPQGTYDDGALSRGVPIATRSKPAAEHSEFGGGKPLMSNDAEERMFRPGE